MFVTDTLLRNNGVGAVGGEGASAGGNSPR